MTISENTPLIVVVGGLVFMLLWLWILSEIMQQQTLLTQSSVPILRQIYLLSLFLSLAVQFTLTIGSLYLEVTSFDHGIFHKVVILLSFLLILFGSLITLLQVKRNEVYDEIERSDQIPKGTLIDPAILFKRPSNLDQPFQGFFYSLLQIVLHFCVMKGKDDWKSIYSPNVANTLLVLSIALTGLKLRACVQSNQISLEYDRQILGDRPTSSDTDIEQEEEEDLHEYAERMSRHYPTVEPPMKYRTANPVKSTPRDPLEAKRVYLVRPTKPTTPEQNNQTNPRARQRNQQDLAEYTHRPDYRPSSDLRSAMNEWGNSLHFDT